MKPTYTWTSTHLSAKGSNTPDAVERAPLIVSTQLLCCMNERMRVASVIFTQAFVEP